MQSLESLLSLKTAEAVKTLFNKEIDPATVTFQKTNKDFEGDITLVVFPYVKLAGKGPEDTGKLIGEYLQQNSGIVDHFNVVKGFLNLVIGQSFWLDCFAELSKDDAFGTMKAGERAPFIMVEYSSPNTNKPLHLGHVRNNLLGYSVSNLLKAAGNKVMMVNLVNDRGIHICKSMLAWQKWGNGETPESSGIKGDHLVGKYYVEFDKHYKQEIKSLVAEGQKEEEAEKNAPLIHEAQQMLRDWEAGKEEVIALWKKMNGWVYDGFKISYKKLGVSFDKTYYESDTYLLGKNIVEKGLASGVLQKRPDGAVIIDLTADKLDQKVLLRSDGTSVYMTQDLGTAEERHKEFPFDKHIYVVGNEQEYHFKVLKIALKRLGNDWAEGLHHLSYGMVELPEGKMKSREGTVVDADDLVDEVCLEAQQMAEERGLIDEMTDEEKSNLYRMVGMGALKYFILKVDPKKTMLFNPAESVKLEGDTGPFIQYAYARTRQVKTKVGEEGSMSAATYKLSLHPKDKELMRLLYFFPAQVKEAAESYSPAVIAAYAYELAKLYNSWYHDTPPIIKETDPVMKSYRALLSLVTGRTIKTALGLLGIEVPEKM
ncbi:MAG: arginyl-tRNA synthetase [Bacteroidetes bacterium]|nr:MAG: arginyl-tRNA synthetase [Bacteroidota bacterium]